MAVMRVALVTCKADFIGQADEQPLVAALLRRGAAVEAPVWDDPTVDWSRFAACLPRTTWDYHERRQEFLQWARHAAASSVLFNPVEVIEWNSHKTYLRDLAAAGLPVAPTIWLPHGEAVDLAAQLDGRSWERAMLKPDVGAGAFATLPFTVDAAGIDAAQRHLDAVLPSVGFLLQPFLDSVGEEGEYSVVYIAGERTHVVRKVPVPGDYRVMDDYGASDMLASLGEAELAMAERARDTCERLLGVDQPLLYARIDLLRDATGALVINEVELVEPSLFFRHSSAAAELLAQRLLARLA